MIYIYPPALQLHQQLMFETKAPISSISWQGGNGVWGIVCVGVVYAVCGVVCDVMCVCVIYVLYVVCGVVCDVMCVCVIYVVYVM